MHPGIYASVALCTFFVHWSALKMCPFVLRIPLSCLCPLHDGMKWWYTINFLIKVKSGILLIVCRPVLSQRDEFLLSQGSMVLGKGLCRSILLCVVWLCMCKSSQKILGIFWPALSLVTSSQRILLCHGLLLSMLAHHHHKQVNLRKLLSKWAAPKFLGFEPELIFSKRRKWDEVFFWYIQYIEKVHWSKVKMWVAQ